MAFLALSNMRPANLFILCSNKGISLFSAHARHTPHSGLPQVSSCGLECPFPPFLPEEMLIIFENPAKNFCDLVLAFKSPSYIGMKCFF